jgi:hypothetical protein
MRNRLTSLLLSGVLGLGASALGGIGLGACVASVGYEYDADVEPPPAQAEVIEERPGSVFIHGDWYRHDGRWEWRPGRYEAVRSGLRYRDGGWARAGNRWHYNEGRWETHRIEEHEGNVIIRDHRRDPPPAVPPGTVIVPARTNP